MKTFVPENPGSNRRWLVVDASEKPLGRLAVTIANALRGKDQPTYTPWVDTGAFVIVTNAAKVKLTGNKEQKKIYPNYKGYLRGRRETTAEEMRAKHPDWMVKKAVEGMLPKNKLARTMMRRLKVYAGPEHPHQAQNPADF
ncbi:MAG: 50S ribosomal protein L13 [Lentisphaerae bacterium]|nr:50S ribosomal protein L13 [Lentisphaerota bacterium]